MGGWVFKSFPEILFFYKKFFYQKFSRLSISKHIYCILYCIVIPGFPYQLHWWVLKSFPETSLFIRKCSLPKVLGVNPENEKDITLNSGRFGPYLKCENKSARLENVEEIFTIGINRAIAMIAEAKPGRMSSSEIKHLGEHPEDKKPVRVMKGKFGPYIKYKSLNATIPEEKDPIEITMDDALILIEKRIEYDKNKRKNKTKR